jgi:hypothetical protein
VLATPPPRPSRGRLGGGSSRAAGNVRDVALPEALRAVIETALPANTIVSEPEQFPTYECDAMQRLADVTNGRDTTFRSASKPRVLQPGSSGGI